MAGITRHLPSRGWIVAVAVLMTAPIFFIPLLAVTIAAVGLGAFFLPPFLLILAAGVLIKSRTNNHNHVVVRTALGQSHYFLLHMKKIMTLTGNLQSTRILPCRHRCRPPTGPQSTDRFDYLQQMKAIVNLDGEQKVRAVLALPLPSYHTFTDPTWWDIREDWSDRSDTSSESSSDWDVDSEEWEERSMEARRRLEEMVTEGIEKMRRERRMMGEEPVFTGLEVIEEEEEEE